MAFKTLLTRNMIEQFRDGGGLNIDMTEWDYVNLHASMYPNREALMDTYTEPARRLTWGELFGKINLVISGLLDRGVKKDDAVFGKV